MYGATIIILMNVYDIPNAVTQKLPDDVVVILQEPLNMHDMLIKKIELHLYKLTQEDRPYDVIVVHLEMGGHTIQMTYDEGYCRYDSLQKTADFIMSQLGMSAIILRARILLDTHMEGSSRKDCE